MLGKKRSNNKKVDFKHKSIKDKMKILNSKKNTNNDDESIKSDDNISEDSSSENEKKVSKKDNNNNNNNTNQFGTDLIENFDEKRIRLAKTFLKKLDNKDSENSSNLSEEENELLEKFTHSNQYKKISFYENKFFSPSEKIFLKGHKSTITDLDISYDSNLILTSSKDCCGILFDISTEKKNQF
jgi:hypothetical protein